jgi:hypothetical protein
MRFKLVLPMFAFLICAYCGQAWAGPVVVACGPGQHSIVREAYLRGEMVTKVECASNDSYRGAAYRPAHYDAREYGRYPVAHPRHRSWGKTALVIGGSTVTGAGIGGVVHGAKGALIGGALGGGVASLYEAAHHR